MSNYVSVVYDLTKFGIIKMNNAIVSSDKDDGVTIEVSFNGGLSFSKIDKLDTKIPIVDGNCKIQVRISFEDAVGDYIYMANAVGYFQNVSFGTTLNFTNNKTNENFQTIVGRNGYYNIHIPVGIYEVWYLSSRVKQVLLPTLNPEVTLFSPTHRLDKEAIIEEIFRDIDWVQYCVFDTFFDRNKMIYGDAIIDSDGDLSDGKTNKKCRYWIVGFE